MHCRPHVQVQHRDQTVPQSTAPTSLPTCTTHACLSSTSWVGRHMQLRCTDSSTNHHHPPTHPPTPLMPPQDAIDRGALMTEPCRASGGPFLPAILATALEVASGMAALHRQDTVHGDLSAFNILLSSTPSSPAAYAATPGYHTREQPSHGASGTNMARDPSNASGSGTPWPAGTALGQDRPLPDDRGYSALVADFGFSRRLNHTALVHASSYGTITHMPPELLGRGLLGKAADVYSFGVLLWQMWTGSRPWAGLSHHQVYEVGGQTC
jgi:serine/threonine protein kinase